MRKRFLSRRDFLRVSGHAGLGSAALTVGSQTLLAGQAGATQHESASGVREIHLGAREITWELAPGKRIKAMAYNGQIPGPEIRLKEGKRGGDWFFHCHKPMHMEGGMITLAKIA